MVKFNVGTSPLVSVVIPTIGRPHLLEKAIGSCLVGRYAQMTEVIVVLNGPSACGDIIREFFNADPRVRYHYSPTPDQNNARNIGIELARGVLIRFLDDDDHLLSEGADEQYDFMLSNSLDFCSGGISLTDASNTNIGRLVQAPTPSPVIAALSRNRLQMVHAHVYRRDSIGDLRWPAGLMRSEDIVWFIRYVIKASRKWQRIDACVGVWHQHPGERQSLNRPSGFVHEVTADVLLEAQDTLMAQGRWSGELAKVTAEALWQLVHRAFPFRPFFWSRMARKAYRLDKASRPDIAMYSYPLLRSIHPLFLLWLTLPKRWISLGMQWLRASRLGWDYRRKL